MSYGTATETAGSSGGITVQVAAVVPCYRVKQQILSVLKRIGPEVTQIIVVDDCCPEQSGAYVREFSRDPRVQVLTHSANQGVGGAVITGYRHAIATGADVVLKIDGDGQMDPQLVPAFIRPIIEGKADYTKGNRFYNIEDVKRMPPARIFGNSVLSFMTKICSGYWHVFDPTNGYTAASIAVISRVPLHRLSSRYFFESDLLFRLGTLRARVIDVPMTAVYADEKSSLRVRDVVGPFLYGGAVNFTKRVFYNYFLRDFTLATLQLLVGLAFLTFGSIFGSLAWLESVRSGVTASTGTVMLSALPIILGVQFLLSFFSYDMASTPSVQAFSLLDKPSTSDGPDRVFIETMPIVSPHDQPARLPAAG